MVVVVAFARISERERASHSWWEPTEVWSKPRLSVETLVDLNIDNLPVAMVWSEVIKDMDDKPRQRLEHLLQGRHISGEVKESVFKEALEVVQCGLGTLAGLKTQDCDVFQSTDKAVVTTALSDSTRHEDDDGSEENNGGGTDKGQGERCQDSPWTGPPPPSPLPLELADKRVPRDASSRLSLRTRHFSSSLLPESSACERMSTHTASEWSPDVDDRISE